ncbi:O-antigen ligase family protein [Flavobacterium sp. LHD-85]|uniref:O-antigen ligase family protein n=1 Tax=Flavobacterium sp. LHD-85 TaxID=3071410 RepID=UPI0027DF67E8|nr:O-antigen ligase family protein [Flavobacterium sp. LHD-85]MDQ6529640.1 O-antigen ligase family protein [Flavobacterium sp. LHD-85]
MKNTKIIYLALVLLHALIALLVFVLPFVSKIYAFLILVVGIYYVYKNKNKNDEVLYVCAYLIGAEVFLRMTGGNFNNEYVKFSVVFFMLLGMIYNNFSRNGLLYLLFLMLLIPGLFVTVTDADINLDFKKALILNLSGPVCLSICAMYMFKRPILFDKLQKIILMIGYPIITTTVYLFLYTPNIQNVVMGTQSNFETSGGFGPNQVSTILGLGMFIFFTQLVFFSKSKFDIIINGGLLVFISFRGIVTFSRGGIITAVVMIILLMAVVYYYSTFAGKKKLMFVFILTALLGIGVWMYSSLQTKGLIDKRYANEDARGRSKKDRLGGREEIMDADFSLFTDSPIFGVGAGMGKSKRLDKIGVEVAAHNEITRLLAEHGLFGILAFLVLLITPFVVYINNRQHLYFLSFYAFWLLTINHAAMRTAAPAFVYALCLLSVQIKIPEETEN